MAHILDKMILLTIDFLGSFQLVLNVLVLVLGSSCMFRQMLDYILLDFVINILGLVSEYGNCQKVTSSPLDTSRL